MAEEKQNPPPIDENIDLANENTNKTEKKVIIHASAYKSIILYATRYANSSIPRENWKEIYGILIGHIDKEKKVVIVEAAEPMTYGESTDVELSAQHYGFIAEIEDKLYAEGKDRFMVGWFHSHPGLSLFYSWVDVKNHLAFQQSNQDFIGIVFDHTYLIGDIKPPAYEYHKSPYNPDYILTPDHPNNPSHTGIVCYRLTDTTMNINHALFDQNFHDVEYKIEGLNQYFFANLLTELSAMVAAGKPLQSAYREENVTESQDSGRDIDVKPQKLTLKPKSNIIKNVAQNNTEIPKNLQTIPTVNLDNSTQESTDQFEQAKKLINQGKTNFAVKDSFSAIENYNKAIDLLEHLPDNQNSNDLVNALSDLTEQCLNSRHDNLAVEYADKLKIKAEEVGNLFELGNAEYFKGTALIRMGKFDEGLSILKNSTVLYENASDYAGVAKVNEIIADLCKKAEDFDSVGLFMLESIKNYKLALQKNNPKRDSNWALPHKMKNSIEKLKNELKNNIIKQIETEEIKNKIKNDLKNL